MRDRKSKLVVDWYIVQCRHNSVTKQKPNNKEKNRVPTLCSRRLCKKSQDAQDVTELFFFSRFSCHPPRCLTVPSSSRWGRQQLKMSHHKLAPWHREPWRNGSAPCVKTRQLRSLSRCKPADRPSSKKMAAKCLLPLSLTGHSRTLRH